MSLPNIIYGDFGDEKVAQSAAIGGLRLGTLMVLPDGRKFRHAKAGGTALGAGVVVVGSAETAGQGGIAGSGLLASTTTTDNTAGATAVVLLAKSQAISLNEFADGVLVPVGPAASAQLGHSYRIESNLSCAVSTTLQITLFQGDGLKVAADPGATLHALRKNPYDDTKVAPAAAAANYAGVTNVAVSADFHYWAQRGGHAAVEQGATAAIAGSGVAVGGQAGSVTLSVAASVVTSPGIGIAIHQAAASQAILVDLMME